MHSPKAHPLQPLVRNLASHAPLDEGDCDALRDLPYTLRTFEPASYLVREGDPPLSCAVLISGFAYRQKLTGDGARQILSIHIPGEPLDFQNTYLREADHSVQMLSRGELAFIPCEALHELARARPAVAHAILIYSLIEASIVREWVLNVGRRNARARLAHVLCEFAIRLEAAGLADGGGCELPMTQEQLADAIGLTPVHVNRTLKTLESEGLISRDRRHVSFPDWNGLREAGDFNQRYLHLEPPASTTAGWAAPPAVAEIIAS